MTAYIDRRFRHDLVPDGPLAVVAADIIGDALGWEKAERVRRRARRPDDLTAFRSAVSAIVANLAYAVVFPQAGARIVTSLTHRPSIGGTVPPGFCRTLRATLRLLEGTEVLHFRGPAEPGLASTIEPTTRFAEEVAARGIGGDHFARDPGAPVVSLASKDREGRRTFHAWPDTDDARAIRDGMKAINAALEGADLAYVGTASVDVRDRSLVRHFTSPWFAERASIADGGRMFGGFWQTMKRAERQYIRIGGERVAEVDFRQAFPRLSYALSGATAPEGDLYSIPGLEGAGGPLRGAVKKAVSTLMFMRGTLRNWPDEIAEDMPSDWPVSRFRKAFLGQHPALRPVLNSGTGWRLMRLESDIMVSVLRRCAVVGITVLPIHDAVLCTASTAETVSAFMREESRAVAGFSLPVSIKGEAPSSGNP